MNATEPRPYMVIETFTSVQGEGTRIGRLSTFVRLAHCNYACTFCDTTYAWKKGEMVTPEKMSARDLAARVDAPDAVLTGGEPLLHDLGPLLEQLGARFVTVETNASMFKPDDRVGLWSLSPKLGSSGHTPDLAVIGQYLEAFPDAVQLKLVVGGEADLREVKDLLTALGEPARTVPVILQPVGEAGESRDHYCEKMRALIEDLILPDTFWHGYQLQFLPQFHKLVWQDQRGI